MIPEFSNPAALLLLLLVPAGLIVAWRRGLFTKRHSSIHSSRVRGILAAATRIVIVLAVVLGLAGLRIRTRTNDLAIIFLVDVSASIPRTELPRVAAFVNSEVGRANPRDYIGIVAFGAEPAVELAPTRKEELAGWQLGDIKSRPARDHTDIAAALRLASGLLPEGVTLRLVLISDGNENLENALSYAPLLAARQISIFTRTVRKLERLPEVAVRAIEAPATVAEGESFELKVQVDSTSDADGKLRVFRNNSLLSERQVHLVSSGENQFLLAERPDRKGFYAYRAEIESFGSDTFKENNAREAIVKVEGRPKTLYLYGDDRPSAGIVRVLRDGNFDADVVPAAGMPSTVAGFQNYDLVVFDNVPAIRLTAGQMNMVRSYVHDLGGGFIMIGGENSFGPGGYYKTPVADVLPVSLDVRKNKHFPSMALAIVIDKSGSMNETQGGAVKIELAKEAAMAALDALTERDQACVVTFDTEAHLVLGLTGADDKRAIHAAVDEITADGGTAIYTGLKQAYDSLLASDAQIKHIIVLSDGESMPGDYPGITRAMREANMTLSSVAVGDEADIATMQMLADAGGGRFYSTENAETLPSIFTREAFMASRSVIIEEPFAPRVTARSQATDGIQWSSAPQLLGYVGTAERDETDQDSRKAAGASGPPSPAVVSLVSDKGDPIYAEWQYGLGHAAAFTSDAKSRWAAGWMNWPGFGQFWEQAMRQNIRRDRAAEAVRLQTSIRFDDDPDYRQDSSGSGSGQYTPGRAGHVLVEATRAGGEFANNLEVRARIVAPDLTAIDMVLGQTAPGQYESDFLAEMPGPYVVTVDGAGLAAGTVGAVKSYSPEFKIADEDSDLLARLAGATGGDIIDTGSGTDVREDVGVGSGLPDKTQPPRSAERDLFDRTRTNTVPHEIWQQLVLFALLLLPLDVAIRRLSISSEDLRHLRDKSRAIIASAIDYAGQRSVGEKGRAGTEGMARLKASRGRVRLRQPGPQSPASNAGGVAAQAEGQTRGDTPDSTQVKTPGRATQPRVAAADAPPPQQSGPAVAPLATRLLDSKRKRNN
jgi:Mg-chelatase subunit ChlD